MFLKALIFFTLSASYAASDQLAELTRDVALIKQKLLTKESPRPAGAVDEGNFFLQCLLDNPFPTFPHLITAMKAVQIAGRPPSLVVGQVDGAMTALNLVDMSVIANNPKHHAKEITTIDVTAKYIVTGSADNTVKVLKVTEGGAPVTLKDHAKGLTNVIVVEDRDLLITKGNDSKIFLYNLNGAVKKQDMTETSSSNLGGIKLWKGKVYVTDDLMNLKVYTIVSKGSGQWRFNLESDTTLATNSDNIISIDIEDRPEEGYEVAWMGTQHGSVLRLQLANPDLGRPQGKLKKNHVGGRVVSLKVTKHLLYTDHLSVEKGPKLFLKSYLEAHHEGKNLNTKSCCRDSYGQVEVIQTGPNSRGVFIYSRLQDNLDQDVMVWINQKYKKKENSMGKLLFAVEEELM